MLLLLRMNSARMPLLEVLIRSDGSGNIGAMQLRLRRLRERVCVRSRYRPVFRMAKLVQRQGGRMVRVILLRRRWRWRCGWCRLRTRAVGEKLNKGLAPNIIEGDSIVEEALECGGSRMIWWYAAVPQQRLHGAPTGARFRRAPT